jgi:hypothetical protein
VPWARLGNEVREAFGNRMMNDSSPDVGLEKSDVIELVKNAAFLNK